MMKLLNSFFLALLFVSTLSAQDIREVTATLLNVRKGPGTSHAVVGQLKNGEQIKVVGQTGNWFEFEGDDLSGFVSGKYLKKIAVPAEEQTNKAPAVLADQDWTPVKLKTGEIADCYSIDRQVDEKLRNFLRIVVSDSTDVIVKLVNFYTGKCIRVVFIPGGNTFSIEQIPEGQYFVKIAYGKEPGRIVENNQCKIRFKKAAIYEKGEEILNYNLRRTDNGGYEVPSYELFLDVTNPHEGRSFEATKIDAAGFDN